ncbi:MAG: TraB/GumN family protein [Bacteroidia bacterium]|nr:TraB/GumN family protein [Bacteroidia bacterium]
MKKLLYLILILPLIGISQTSKKYPTLLWKISGKNLKKPSYLYGTMHVSNRVAYYLSEQFFDALKSVDVVGLETNPGEWLENMEKTGELSELNQTRNMALGQDFYRTAFNARFPDKKMLQGILSYDPDIIDGLLYRQNRSRENFEESTYIDLFIFQSASKLNKQLISLEDFSQSEIKARLSALPDDKEESNQNNYSNFYSFPQKIEDAYREGNLDLLDSLSKLSSSKNTQRYLINDRNVFFVNTIDSVLKTKTLFSGVGAAHLPGDEGVIELLRKKGYTVEPVYPKVTKKSHATREELDVMVKPVSFQKQSVSDSAFNLSLPGKLYPIINIENLKYYIYADMVNGSFYTVVRLKHMGPQFNVSTEQLMARVDSLLFENIPGKIIEKKEINGGNGIKGIEVVNRTRRGDDQHYQIYFTDLEMIMFKLGGKRQYASGNEAKQFFNSIAIAPKSDNNIDFSPKTKGFSVKIPANHSYIKNDASGSIGLVEDLYAYNRGTKSSYGLKQAVYNDFNYLEEDTFELNQLAKNTLVNYNFTVTPKYELSKEQNLPAIRFSAKNSQNQYLNGKIIIKGVHYYFVYCIAPKENGFNNEFFNSFKLTDFEFVNVLKEITDRDYCFKAIDEVTENALSRFNEAYTKAYEATQTKKDSVKNDYEYKSGNKFYYSPSSNEYVNISFEKFNDYDFREKKDIEKKLTENIKSGNTLQLTNKSTGYKNGLYTYRCILKDTATARAIDLRVFIKHGILQQICAPYDTTIGLRGWTKGFMESFTTMDTLLGKDIFVNKYNTLLDDLCSNDTVKRQAANLSLRNSLGMQKEYADEFVKFIGSKRLDLVHEEARAQMFVNGGTIENEKILPPYKALYKHYTDSFYLQLCLLKGLAFLKTKDSYTTFCNLLLTETPLVGDALTVGDVFSVLHDSLQLCKNFFPSMLALTKYDEYRDAVYSLMADLVNQKILPPASYAALKEGIVVDANLALKRYNPQAAKPSSGDEYNNFDYLDKNVKELAENIKAGIDGLSNTALFKNGKDARGADFYSRPALVNYGYILAPFYNSDEKVKQIFSKLNKIKTQDVAMPLTINLIKHGVVINDTLSGYYTKNKFTRIFYYHQLEKEKLSDKFDKNYLTQQIMAESLISSHKQLNNLYNDKDRNRKDSLQLIKTINATNRYQKGKIYVYKSGRGKNEEEQWSAVFVPESKTLVTNEMEIVSSGYTIDKTKSEEENTNELLNYFYLNHHKRAGNNVSSTVNY